MYKISKKLLIANSLLALSTAAPYDCQAADDWKKFLHNWQSGLDSSEEEMEVVEQTPQRTPRFSSQIAHDAYYNKNKQDSSSEDSQSSVEEEMPNETEIGQAQPEIQIPVIPSPPTPGIRILPKPKTRNHNDAFGSSGAQSHPQKTFGMKKAKPNQPELSPAEQNWQLKIKELEEQQTTNKIAFENESKARKVHYITTQTKNEKDALQNEYEEAVNKLKLELEMKQQLLNNELSKGYNLLELNQHVEKVKFNILLEEQKKNVLFEVLFLGIDGDFASGLPLDIWGNIFYHICQGGDRSNFSLISKKCHHIAKVFTHKIKVIAPVTQWNQDGGRMLPEYSLKDLEYIIASFPNCNHITASNSEIPLLDILKLAPKLKFLTLKNTLIYEYDDFSNLMTNLKSLRISNGLYLSPSFVENIAKIEELSLCYEYKGGISLANDNLKLFTNLKSLYYDNNQVSEDIFKELTNLTCLTVSGPQPRFNPDQTLHNGLQYLTNLTSLTIPDNFLYITTYNILTNLKSLNDYSLPSDRFVVNDSGKIYINKSPATKIKLIKEHAYSMHPRPRIYTNPIDRRDDQRYDEVFEKFDSLTNKPDIEEINIHNSNIIKIKDFNNFKNLKILHLGSYKSLTDNCFKPLKNLRVLFLDANTKISDKAFDFLTNLEELSLVETNASSFLDTYNITNKGLQKLSKLTSLDLKENIYITDVGIQNLTNLTKLNLGKNELITNEGIKNLTNLEELNLGWNMNITAEGVKNMNKLINITQNQD